MLCLDSEIYWEKKCIHELSNLEIVPIYQELKENEQEQTNILSTNLLIPFISNLLKGQHWQLLSTISSHIEFSL